MCGGKPFLSVRVMYVSKPSSIIGAHGWYANIALLVIISFSLASLHQVTRSSLVTPAMALCAFRRSPYMSLDCASSQPPARHMNQARRGVEYFMSRKKKSGGRNTSTSCFAGIMRISFSSTRTRQQRRVSHKNSLRLHAGDIRISGNTGTLSHPCRPIPR